MNGERHIPVCGDFVRIFDEQTFLSMLNSRDEALIALKFHLIMEEFINIWCSKITGLDDLFKGMDFVPFKTKLQIARNLGLNEDFYRSLDKLNGIRNKYSHRLKFEVGNSDVESLASLIDNCDVGSLFSKCSEFTVASSGLGQDGGRVSETHSWASDNKKRLFIMCVTLTTKLTFWMQEQFNGRGISYTLTTGLPQEIEHPGKV